MVQLGWFEDVSPELIARQFDTNLFGAMRVTRAILPIMRHQSSGHIFAISSIGSMVSSAGGSIYSASKFASEGWMEGLSKELKPLGITATIVQPGFFRTDFLDRSSLRYGDRDVEDYREQFDKFKSFLDSMNHTQIGDPAKLATALIQISEMTHPPLRFCAGSDAHERVIEKARAILSEAGRLRDLSRSTDGP